MFIQMPIIFYMFLFSSVRLTTILVSGSPINSLNMLYICNNINSRSRCVLVFLQTIFSEKTKMFIQMPIILCMFLFFSIRLTTILLSGTSINSLNILYICTNTIRKPRCVLVFLQTTFSKKTKCVFICSSFSTCFCFPPYDSLLYCNPELLLIV